MVRNICIACGVVIVLSLISEITTAPSNYGSEPAAPPPAASYGGSAPAPPAPQPSSDCEVSGDAYSGGGESSATGGGSSGKTGPSYGSSPGLRKGCVHTATYDGLGGSQVNDDNVGGSGGGQAGPSGAGSAGPSGAGPVGPPVKPAGGNYLLKRQRI